MKHWILKTFFQKELETLFDDAKRAGSIDAFEKARDDLEQMMIDTTDEKAEEMSDRKLAELLSNFDPKMVVSVDSRTKALLIGGERPDAGKIANLRSEAEVILASDLWKILYETPKALAERAMFVDDGKLENQLLKGRAILFMLGTQKKVLDTLKNAVIPIKEDVGT